ncbi:hypothetical protein SRB5_02050 [Streptomyces sp. RB5]|uniref:GatB/YqeY domain-containing protein n=1 Tax=Streptomyces smaragdinus TaxID=2585196 RepID=A0A7K0C9H7_9ACTN|nr:hypothetical protein [Streptomyces smaragdinus]MQY10100.1 hypothetical protein [Streptomyces smaragdinus]
MTRDHAPADEAGRLRAAMRADLVAAMKARRPDTVRALRSAIAAIDNAEAVPVSDEAVAATGEHIAGARLGVGAAEAERRTLDADDVRALLRDRIAEYDSEAAGYVTHGQANAAQLLRREADVLRAYLS